MELLKTCDTNAQAIGDFEAIEYQSFSIKRDPAQPLARPDERKLSEDPRAVEAELRQQQHLVIQDASRPWIWLFRATKVDQVGQAPRELPTVPGYELTSEHSGIMKASELMAQPPLRPLNRASASTMSPATPLQSKPPQSGTGRPPDSQQPFDIWTIYELFTSSVVASIAYFIAKDYHGIGLNYRTFLSKPFASQEPDRRVYKLDDTPYQLNDINVYWASSGTLIVSITSVLRPEIRCLEDVILRDVQKDFLGRVVRVSPFGAIAMVVSFDDPLDSAAEDTTQRMQRKRARMNTVEHGIGRWKALVKRWLHWKGYSLSGLENKTSWVRISITPTIQTALTSPIPGLPTKSREILWPAAMLFYYDDPSAPNISLLPTRTAPLDWFETSQSPGFSDPIDLAQQWFVGKAERDKLIEARRRAQKAEEEAARPKDEMPGGLFPSSPLNARAGAYGELQAISGVYPTPPDGIVPAAATSGDTPSVTGVATSTVLVPGGSNPAINLSAPQDAALPDESAASAASPDFSTHFEQFNGGGGNDDDLFEEMDQDRFEGNGVTDADFNFFDEPDGDDVDMLDASTMQDIKPPPKKPSKEKAPQSKPETPIKEDTSNPMAALEDALAMESATHGSISGVKLEQEEAELEPPLTASSQENEPSTKENAVAPVDRGPTPPLSPNDIHDKLRPSSMDQSGLQRPRLDSAFDPIIFNQKMKLSDAKYLDGRFGALQGKLVQADEETDSKSNLKRRPASLRDIPLMTKLRYAIGVATSKGIPEISHLARADDDFTDASSETSSVFEDDVDDVVDVVSLPPEPLSAGLIMGGGKRKLPTDGNATPLSSVSFADSLGESFELGGLQTDDSCLALMDASPWDWSLALVPGPVEVPASTGRYSIPTFSPAVASLPGTPTSQPDFNLDPPDEKPLSRNDCIAVTQVVTEQVASSTLDVLHQHNEDQPVTSSSTASSKQLEPAVTAVFPNATECTVSSLIAIHDVFPENLPQPKGPQRAPPRRPNEPAPTPGNHLYQINSSYIRIRRADTLWDLLPPALAFWETLGLSPCSPPKNVATFCIYPNSDSLKPCLENFMLNMQVAYEGCKLGAHTKGETLADYENGLIPVIMGTQPSFRMAFKSLRDTCYSLGKVLAVKLAQMRKKDEPKIDAFVIYMIDPFDNPSSVWELCSAFWSLFQSYGQGPQSRPDQMPKPDLVLQIVPMKYIASFDSPVMLSTSTYINLAREVYDRCPPSSPSEDKTPLSIYSAPAFQLEESIPRQIPFSLNADTPQDLLRENSYMHIGYAISLDGAWLTAAWTDRCGKSQTIVSYNLGTRVFGEIAKEIWATTIEILQARKVTWRICIAKSGVMEREELDTWKYLASCPTHFNLFTTLLTVDPHPSLQIHPNLLPAVSLPTGNTQPSTNTPGSTPQAGVSPDPHNLTPAATPSADSAPEPATDPDARLVDVTDESWGIVLAHRLHNSNSTVEFRPALISGLLVKRGVPSGLVSDSSGPSAAVSSLPSPSEPGPIVVGVNILWVGAVNPTNPNRAPGPQSPFPLSADGTSPGPSPVQERPTSSLMWTPTAQMRTTAENLLKEMIGQFRALGTLARLKGVQGTRGGAVPWHVAVAKRGVEGLTRCLASPSG
ncbi:hypothetical protein BU24DRAFT_455466 [Aaosphaeria arxii CBS 175.79]|uniref:Mediator of RNA polymerase II transcription subunit 13 n=1 Tax=Aaosphaeria arxii CBS 175.79 TaxID=1450172 RepID=A0A6A5X9S0_9PLEO|nr:uncharacterized protein BU24DRAFT_455466 [Aaosphaeria arxii CBS 175.79]KAF2009494.1 hypothetical protein BU24DRAFT_455466 [Aaosphaeria arxii CBS 175.79]